METLLSDALQKELLQLVRQAIDAYLHHKAFKPDYHEPPLESRGVFVTLYKHNNILRGCIGHLEPMHQRLEDEIAACAVASAFSDPRFPPLTLEELKDIRVEISLLYPAEKVSSKSELDPKTYGVIVSHGFRRGVLLPDIEGVDTVDMQLAIACRKAGISPHENFVIERFRVDKIRES